MQRLSRTTTSCTATSSNSLAVARVPRRSRPPTTRCSPPTFGARLLVLLPQPPLHPGELTPAAVPKQLPGRRSSRFSQQQQAAILGASSDAQSGGPTWSVDTVVSFTQGLSPLNGFRERAVSGQEQCPAHPPLRKAQCARVGPKPKARNYAAYHSGFHATSLQHCAAGAVSPRHYQFKGGDPAFGLSHPQGCELFPSTRWHRFVPATLSES
jgi:hypothetical protein